MCLWQQADGLLLTAPAILCRLSSCSSSPDSSVGHDSLHVARAADDGIDEGMAGSSGEEDGEAEENADGEDTGGISDEEGGAGRREQQPGAAGFLEGGKAASFAKAFAKIVEGSGKRAADAAAAAAAQQTAAAPAAAAAPILATSKSIAKRKAEEAEEAKADREAKKLRQEMKQRGHTVRLGVHAGACDLWLGSAWWCRWQAAWLTCSWLVGGRAGAVQRCC